MPAYASDAPPSDVSLPVASLPGSAESGSSDCATATLLNPDTGSRVTVPAAELSVAGSDARAASSLRRRLRAADVHGAWAGDGPGAVTVDPAAQTYRFGRYPPLAFLVNSWLYVIFGAFLVAAAAQVVFLFPCYSEQVAVTGADGKSYCVASGDAGSVACSASAPLCAQRIPVTMQTYAVLLNGALAGRTGALATALYVAMVCVGAPFGAGGKALAIWQRGALIGSTGGYLAGFVAASYIMGVCAERADDRPSWRIWRMVLWMCLAEVRRAGAACADAR